MPSVQHEKLSELAAKWAKKQGFPIIATNLGASGCREKVDLIAFRSNCTLMIESKVSRADFRVDAKKPERQTGGVGTYRFYITPVNMVSISEIPDGWGLLYVEGKKVIEMVKPRGNMWPPFNTGYTSEWDEFKHVVNQDAERALLFSITRRLAQNKPILN
ncbi:hypothetical protein [Moritella sp. F3]|uniref:hypothetical protein n=1 Tax=Moritella sp. F3 TaxID=2718882 RepID=UPI0018E19F1A|nr:hypothetical protein [Moritella sp. F3]GIC77643.1 hypothetical protein FMO001_23700 [Moritella sp. F1]GIC82056.1 hypothetical protein FMO003_23370 [Moritella sp. F3]